MKRESQSIYLVEESLFIKAGWHWVLPVDLQLECYLFFLLSVPEVPPPMLL